MMLTNILNVYAQDQSPEYYQDNSISETNELSVIFLLHDTTTNMTEMNNVKYEIRTYDNETDINSVELPYGYTAGSEGQQSTWPSKINENMYVWHLATEFAWDNPTIGEYELMIDYVDSETSEVVRNISIGRIDKSYTTVDLDRLASAPDGYDILGDSFPITFETNDYKIARATVPVKKNDLRKAGILSVRFVTGDNGYFREIGSVEIDLINFAVNTSESSIPVRLSDVSNYIPSGYEAYGYTLDSIIYRALAHPLSYSPYDYLDLIVEKKLDQISFSDVTSLDWFYNSVKYVYDNGLMTGLNETTFGPYENLARAQFAVILHRMNGSPDMEYTNKFPDVADNQWYTDAILWANEAGVVGGYTDTGKFGPGDNINREQMAVMMYRYANYLGYDTSARADISKYTDAGNVNEFAKEAMSWAVGEGIITGKYNETQLDPQGNASRAECATIIMRFMEYYK